METKTVFHAMKDELHEDYETFRKYWKIAIHRMLEI